jgi:hypothetical protein
MIDRRGPSISVVTPAAGGVYRRNAVVNASYDCSDDGSGVASCTGTVANGARVSTSSLGKRTFTVTATDQVGNRTSTTSTYTVNP